MPTTAFRTHDEPDLAIDLDRVQRDHRVDVSLGAQIPLYQRVAFFVRGGYVVNQSTYAIEEFDNLSVASGLRLRF